MRQSVKDGRPLVGPRSIARSPEPTSSSRPERGNARRRAPMSALSFAPGTATFAARLLARPIARVATAPWRWPERKVGGFEPSELGENDFVDAEGRRAQATFDAELDQNAGRHVVA